MGAYKARRRRPAPGGCSCGGLGVGGGRSVSRRRASLAASPRADPPLGCWESCTCCSAVRPLPLPSGPVSGPGCPPSGAGRLSGQWSSWSTLWSVVKLVAFCVHISANPNLGITETACRLSTLGEVQLGGSVYSLCSFSRLWKSGNSFCNHNTSVTALFRVTRHCRSSLRGPL